MAGEYASWDLVPAWEREGWELLGWTPERYNQGKGPLNIPWSSLTERQKELSTLILELDQKGWTEAVEQEKQAVFDRAEEAMAPKLREELDDVVEDFLGEVSRMTAVELGLDHGDAQLAAETEMADRRHNREVVDKAASVKEARNEKHRAWLEAVEAERKRLHEEGATSLSWDKVEQLLGREAFMTVDPALVSTGGSRGSPRRAGVGSAFSYERTRTKS